MEPASGPHGFRVAGRSAGWLGVGRPGRAVAREAGEFCGWIFRIRFSSTSNSRRGGRSGVVIYRIGGVSLPPRQQQQRAKATATTTTRAMMMKMMMMQRPNDSAIWDQWAVLQLLLPAGVPAGSRAPAWAHARCRRPGQRPPAAAMVASWGAAASALRLIVCCLISFNFLQTPLTFFNFL